MRFVVSGNLLRFTSGAKEITLDERSLDRAVDQLVDRHPGLSRVLIDSRGDVRQVHQMFLNGEQLARDERSGVDLATDDEVYIITSVAGG